MRKSLAILAFFLVACSRPADTSPQSVDVITSTTSGPASTSTPHAAAFESTPGRQTETTPTIIVLDETLTSAPSLVWQAAVGEGLAAPAQLAGGRAVVASEESVTALDPYTGVEIWQVTPEDGIWPRSLTHDNERIYAGIPGGLLALRTSDGKKVWQIELKGEALWPPLVSGALFLGTAFVGPGIRPDPAGRAWIYALDPQTGEQMWASETEAYTLTTPAASPEIVFVGGSLLGQKDVEEGGYLRLHAFDGRDGSLLWTVDSLDGFLKSLATGGGQVYYLAYSDVVVGLDADSGEETWRYSTENWSPGFTMDNNRLFFGSDNAFVHAVNGDSGLTDWRVHLEGVFNAPRGRPALMGDCILFQGNDNRLYCLHQEDGSLIWQTEPQPRSRVALAAGEGHLFLSGQDGVLYAYRTR